MKTNYNKSLKAVNESKTKIFNAGRNAKNMGHLCEKIHIILGRHIDVTNFFIGLYHNERDIISFPYAVDDYDDFPEDTYLHLEDNHFCKIFKDELIPVFLDKKKLKEFEKHNKISGTTPVSWISVPLIKNGDIFGIMAAQSYTNSDCYTQKDIEILSTLANQASYVIDLKQKEDRYQYSEKITRTLFNISNTVNTSENLIDLYKSIHSILDRVIDAKNFFIALYNHEKDEVIFPYYIDNVDDDSNPISNLSDSSALVGKVIKSGKPVFFDKRQMNEYAHMVNKKLIGNASELWLGTPLKIKGKVIGAMVAQSYTDPGRYSTVDAEILSSVSDQIAIAIDRKRAEELQKQSEKITRTLFSISNAVNTTRDLNDLYRSIHSILGQVIDTTNFFIALYDSEKDQADFPYYIDESGFKTNFISNLRSSSALVGKVIKNAEPIFFNKKKMLDYVKSLGKKLVGSPSEQWMGTPLKIHEKVIGAIVVQSYSDSERYTVMDAEILSSVSDQVAIAIDRKRRAEAQKESEKINQAMFDIANAVNSTKYLVDLYKSIHTIIGRIMDLTNFYIAVYEDSLLTFPYFVDQFDKKIPSPVSAMESKILSTVVFNTRKPLFLNEEELIEKAQKHEIQGTTPKTWLGVPLMIDNDVIGLMVTQSYSDAHLYDQRNMDILCAVSEQIAIAIDRKKYVQELKISKIAAERANEAKSLFLANMSHEIRTPLNGILGNVTLLRATNLSDDQMDFLQTITYSADHLLGTINDILDFSKIQAGELELENTHFDLYHTIESVSDALTAEALQKGLNLNCVIDPDIPVHLKGDPGRLRQILFNLLGNAIKFTKSGEVTLSCQSPDETTDRVELEFKISDTGIGIAPDKLENIFLRFEQADNSMTRKFGGTGIGLSISRQIVELMGGNIFVTSKEKQGSTFHVRVWFYKNIARTDSVIPSSLNLKSEQFRALIVNHNDADRESISHMLSQLDFAHEVIDKRRVTIETMEKALNADWNFNLIIMSDQVPDMDVYETCRQIKLDPRFQDTMIIMIATIGIRGDAKRCKSAGISGYLVKPIDRNQLFQTIQQVKANSKTGVENPLLVTRHTIQEYDPEKHLNVLIVEDNPVNAKMEGLIIKKAGHHVTTVENGKLALDALKDETFDAILMDIQMPVMNGIEATKAIRKREKTTGAHIPIIAVTAHALKQDRDQCLAVGMDEYLTKPINPQLVHKALRNLTKKIC